MRAHFPFLTFCLLFSLPALAQQTGFPVGPQMNPYITDPGYKTVTQDPTAPYVPPAGGYSPTGNPPTPIGQNGNQTDAKQSAYASALMRLPESTQRFLQLQYNLSPAAQSAFTRYAIIVQHIASNVPKDPGQLRTWATQLRMAHACFNHQAANFDDAKRTILLKELMGTLITSQQRLERYKNILKDAQSITPPVGAKSCVE